MKGGREEGGRHSEGSLRKPLTIWHIVSRAVSRINRFKPCSGRTNTDGCCHSSCFLGRFYQKKKKKPVLEINALLKSLQSYVSDRLHLQSSAGKKKTRRQNARSVITETITHNKLLLMLVDSVFRPREWITAVRMKLEKKKKNMLRRASIADQQFKNILRLWSFWESRAPAERERLLDAWCYFALV